MREFNTKGFTLIELLIVIAIIGVLVAVVFVALDPATRFQQARDAVRQNDVQEIVSAIKLDQIDNGGSYLATITATTVGEIYMITGSMDAGCDDNACDFTPTSDTHCVNLAGLVIEGYLNAMPVSPTGVTTWDDGGKNGAEGTGYTLQKKSDGIIYVRGCESEYVRTSEIEAAR